MLYKPLHIAYFLKWHNLSVFGGEIFRPQFGHRSSKMKMKIYSIFSQNLDAWRTQARIAHASCLGQQSNNVCEGSTTEQNVQ